LWGDIQLIRRMRDRAFPRWMPHINILYPFLREGEEFASRAPEISQALAEFPPFSITFASLGHFKHGKGRKTVHLVPKSDPPDALARLYQLFMALFPTYARDNHAPKEFRPHLTIGQWDLSVSPAMLEQECARLLGGLSFSVDHLSFIAREETTPFVVKHNFVLGGRAAPP
jgi:poly(A) polymerase